MSWIIGFVGASLSREIREGLVSFCHDTIHESSGDGHLIACGGLEETCLAEHSEAGDWFVSGTGIAQENSGSRILDRAGWQACLAAERPELRRLGGGFVVVRWDGRTVEALNDTLGLRTFFWTNLSGGFAFSTRLDWLAALRGGVHVNYASFGSHWLAFNQIGFGCLARRIRRLPPGGSLRLSANAEQFESSAWLPGSSYEPPHELLRRFLTPENAADVSLGLSGGLDSRTLLALRPRNRPLSIHIFGPHSRADVRIATRLCELSEIDYTRFAPPAVDVPGAMEVIGRHSVMAQAVSPATASLSLHHYSALRAQGKTVVDGGFGEVMRRQFMNRLLRRARRGFSARRASDVLPHLTFHRADFFVPEVSREMWDGARRDLQAMLDDLPVGESDENLLDLLAVRTRLPNFFGFEQARLDSHVQSYMPYAHPAVLDSVFAIPPAGRRNGRVSREIIDRLDPSLKTPPLVKGGVAYPYPLSALLASAYVKVRRRLHRQVESESSGLLQALREPVLDRLHSGVVKSCESYDYTKLRSAIETFFVTGHGAGYVDWWLAFDLWRESLETGIRAR